MQTVKKPIVWSCGGGVQSAAIAALIIDKILPMPDRMVMADTSRESRLTWEYMQQWGLEIEIVGHEWASVDLMTGADKATIAIPMFTNGNTSLPKYCSNEWKTRPIQRYLRSKGLGNADLWIGFSTDEFQRLRRYEDKQKWQHLYPLIDLRMSRNDCLAMVVERWGTPPKSCCWMCPYRTDPEWLALPGEEFKKAVELEGQMREHDPDVHLHRRGQLETVNLNAEQADLFDIPCDSGNCFT